MSSFVSPWYLHISVHKCYLNVTCPVSHSFDSFESCQNVPATSKITTCRDHFVFAPSQLEMRLHYNIIPLLLAGRIFAGFPQLLKNHWNSDLFQDHGKIIEFHEKFLKFGEMKKSGNNHWILDQSLMEKSLNSEIDIVLTNYMGK